MRQLDTCDFCGDAAEGVYEVVPASVAGDSHRLALCADCRTTLQSVVDPLLDAVEADDSDSATSAAASTADDSDSATSAAASTADDSDAAAATTATADDGGSDATAAATADSDASADASGTATSDDADSEGVTIEVGGSEGDGETETADGDADDANAGDGDADDDAATDGSRTRRPSGYAQLIRLLQNRDGAMAREDLRALATNAYDIGSTEFETALEAAVENGDVEETADGLRTV